MQALPTLQCPHRERLLVLARLLSHPSDRLANLSSLLVACRPGCSSLHSCWCLSLRSKAEVGRIGRGGSFPQAAGTQHTLPASLPVVHCWMAGAMRSMHAMLLASQRHVRPPAPRPTDPRAVAITRIGGLATGVAVMLLMSVVILPKSASIEALYT